MYLGNERVVVGELVVDVISFQKIFGLCSLKCHIMEIWRDVTLVHGRTTECEDSARILKQNSQYVYQKISIKISFFETGIRISFSQSSVCSMKV